MWEEVARRQAGLAGRGQLIGCGMTLDEVRHRVESGRWRRVHPGVYATHTGPLDDRAAVWAALLSVGPPSVAGFGTALWLHGVLDSAPRLVHVCVPQSRRVRVRPGVVVHVQRRFAQVAHPSAADPPRARLEEALLDAAGAALDAREVVDLVLRGVQRRLTVPARLRAALAGRPRHPWRALLTDVLADAEDGAQSPLELRYLRAVERGHRLPQAQRNRAEAGTGGRVYRDVRYRRWGVVVELDGREAHPGHEAFRDRARDNRLTVDGGRVLRYGWREVAGEPCAVAAEVAAVLQAAGWPGMPSGCGRDCPLREEFEGLPALEVFALDNLGRAGGG